jgi:hypothetical protein
VSTKVGEFNIGDTGNGTKSGSPLHQERQEFHSACYVLLLFKILRNGFQALSVSCLYMYPSLFLDLLILYFNIIA